MFFPPVAVQLALLEITIRIWSAYSQLFSSVFGHKEIL